MCRGILHTIVLRWQRWWRCALTVLLGVVVFLFWWCCHPEAMSYQEQNQLFLFSTTYFLREVGLAGGLAVWIGEFLVQFYYVEWLGAAVLAMLFVCLQRVVWAYIHRFSVCHEGLWYGISFVPAGLLLWCMGDYNLLLSFPVALILSLLLAMVMFRRSLWWEVAVVPIAYWLIGSALWLYVVLRLVARTGRGAWKGLWLAPYLLSLQLATAYTVMAQWSTADVLCGVGYHRIPHPWQHLTVGYNKEVYSLLRYDYLVRHERWDDVVRYAERYQPETAFTSVCVNLALAKKRQLAERQFEFFQNGRDALVMGIFRDNTSDLPSMEVFWHLSMINACLRYAFDLQEAILNARRSGRLTKRLAECYVINGRYDVARKHLALLKRSLFYRRWALATERLLLDEGALNRHPVYGEKRQLRFKTDFLYNYNEIDKVFGRLFVNNPKNTTALDYFMAQMLLRGSVNAFVEHLPWVQQYGGYARMPRAYADALRCIEAHGAVDGSPYAQYIDYMRRMGRLKE